MDPTNLTNVAVQLTAEQISNLFQEKVVLLLVSMGLMVLGGITGSKIRNEVGKIIGFVLAGLGAIGTLTFTLQLINLSTQMI